MEPDSKQPQTEADNTIPYTGDISKLPKCKLCDVGEGEEHTYLTYNHPYKMR